MWNSREKRLQYFCRHGTNMFRQISKKIYLIIIVLAAVLACSDPDPISEDPSDTGPDGSAEDVLSDPPDATDSTPDADADGDAAADADAGAEGDDVEDASIEPQVAFAEPADEAVLDNPITFQIEASGVDEVEIFADETYSLGPAFDPDEEDELLYRFAGTGFARPLHVEGRVDGEKVARADLTITVNHDSCADTFFITEFDDINVDPSGELDMFNIRESSLAAIKDEIETLQSCGADITLGAMLSLLMWEAAFRAGSYNTRCNENSYHNTESDCDEVAEALYSYQFGIGGMHTSNFHPCKGGSYTQGMRDLFMDLADQAGYSTDADLMTEQLTERFHEVCPNDSPTAVDYYLLGAHDPFGIPKNDNGNYLEAVGVHPLMDTAVSVPLTFNILHGQCDTIDDDREAIAIWGGGDERYATQEHQDSILSHYNNFQAANCD